MSATDCRPTFREAEDTGPPPKTLFLGGLRAFRRRTGVGVLLNTSFNIMGKPIIHSVEDAIAMFFTSGLDVLVIEDVVFVKDN